MNHTRKSVISRRQEIANFRHSSKSGGGENNIDHWSRVMLAPSAKESGDSKNHVSTRSRNIPGSLCNERPTKNFVSIA